MKSFLKVKYSQFKPDFSLIFILVLRYVVYSIVKDSNADSGVIFKFLQNPPIIKAVCTKISFFLHICKMHYITSSSFNNTTKGRSR